MHSKSTLLISIHPVPPSACCEKADVRAPVGSRDGPWRARDGKCDANRRRRVRGGSLFAQNDQHDHLYCRAGKKRTLLSASAFVFKSEWPVCAALSLVFVTVKFMRVGTVIGWCSARQARWQCDMRSECHSQVGRMVGEGSQSEVRQSGVSAHSENPICSGYSQMLSQPPLPDMIQGASEW